MTGIEICKNITFNDVIFETINTEKLKNTTANIENRDSRLIIFNLQQLLQQQISK
jgi:hypothetical protein